MKAFANFDYSKLSDEEALKAKEGLIVIDNIAFEGKKTKDCVKFLEAIKAKVKEKMELFGSVGKA